MKPEEYLRAYKTGQVTENEITGAVAFICEDFVNRTKADVPPQIQHYTHTVPMHTVAKLLMDLSDGLKEQIKMYGDISHGDKARLMEDVSNACANFDKAVRPYISK